MKVVILMLLLVFHANPQCVYFITIWFLMFLHKLCNISDLLLCIWFEQLKSERMTELFTLLVCVGLTRKQITMTSNINHSTGTLLVAKLGDDGVEQETQDLGSKF